MLLRRVPAVLVLVLAGALAAGPAAASTAGPEDGGRGPALRVTGFQEQSSPTSRVVRSVDALTTVGVDGVNLVPDGSRVRPPEPAALRQLRVTHREDLRGELLVGNYDVRTGDFSEPVAHRMLSDAGSRRAVVGQLVGLVRRQGWDGVSVDLEALAPRDRAGLTAFVRGLAGRLPDRATLSIAVSLHGSTPAYRRAGYDLPALARAVDVVTLMAYDQHGPWEDRTGPVGALRWQREGLEAMLRSVPARQVDLGVAAYAYAWRPHRNTQLGTAAVRRLVAADGARARWVPRVGEWTARLSDGSTVWWSDRRSYARRVGVAQAYDLHGLAVWSLGLGDPLA